MYKIILIMFFFSSTLLSQHLPLKIGNQWHYDPSAVPGGVKYAAIAVDTTIINNKTYYKIERRHAFTGQLLSTTFDRFENDHLYYRLNNNIDSLIIDFNWPVGYTQTTNHGDTCYDFYILDNISIRNVWGFNTESYSFRIGYWCLGMPDTAWVLFSPEIVRMFGCYWAGDGRLEGAIIDGTTYGDLYPLPVELISFTYDVQGNILELSWTTTTETNNSGFEILRKAQNDNNWESIGFIPGHGTTTEPQFYSFTDDEVESGKYQYRLKQIDFDGSFKYSEIIEVEIELPAEFYLSQNYPNPFNSTTKISYILPEGTFVSLIVYDCLANNVKTLVNEFQEAGLHQVLFVEDNLPSGLYFLRIMAGEWDQTRKMVLLR